MRRLPLLALPALVFVGCADSGSHVSTTTSTNVQLLGFDVYFLREGKLTSVCRVVQTSKRPPVAAAIAALAKGPTPSERSNGLTTDVPHPLAFQVSRSPEKLAVTVSGSLGRPALAQLTQTLTDLGRGPKIVINGKTYASSDFEAQTPAIFIKFPCLDKAVQSPLYVAGNADTFEATFVVELRAGARTLARKTVRAWSGSGARGIFATNVAFSVANAKDGELRAYEVSAKDGKPVNVVNVPLSLLP